MIGGRLISLTEQGEKGTHCSHQDPQHQWIGILSLTLCQGDNWQGQLQLTCACPAKCYQTDQSGPRECCLAGEPGHHYSAEACRRCHCCCWIMSWLVHLPIFLQNRENSVTPWGEGQFSVSMVLLYDWKCCSHFTIIYSPCRANLCCGVTQWIHSYADLHSVRSICIKCCHFRNVFMCVYVTYKNVFQTPNLGDVRHVALWKLNFISTSILFHGVQSPAVFPKGKMSRCSGQEVEMSKSWVLPNRLWKSYCTWWVIKQTGLCRACYVLICKYLSLINSNFPGKEHAQINTIYKPPLNYIRLAVWKYNNLSLSS